MLLNTSFLNMESAFAVSEAIWSQSSLSNFMITTAVFSSVRIFQIFTVLKDETAILKK